MASNFWPVTIDCLQVLSVDDPDPPDALAREDTTKSTHSAIETLELDHLYVAHAGLQRFPLTDSTSAVPAADVLSAPTAVDALDER